MKKLLALTLAATLLTTAFGFAEPDTSIGQIEKAKLSIFRIDEKKLYEKAKKEKGREPVIIKAETLPTNNISQGFNENEEKSIIGYRDGVVGKNAAIYARNGDVFGKSVTITKKQLLEADYVLMQSLALKNFRKVGTANGGDIYAIDVMTLQHQSGGEWNTAAQDVLYVKRKNKEGEYPVNRTKSIPSFESEEKVFYEASNTKDVEIGKWYTTTIGNTLKENKDSTFPYSSKDIEYVKVRTMPYKEQYDKHSGQYFIPAPESATQLIITEW